MEALGCSVKTLRQNDVLAYVLGQITSSFGIVVVKMLATRTSSTTNLLGSPMNFCDYFRPLTIEFSMNLG